MFQRMFQKISKTIKYTIHTPEGTFINYGEMQSHNSCVTNLERHRPRLEQDRGLQEGGDIKGKPLY